jgi:hypothetical protein
VIGLVAEVDHMEQVTPVESERRCGLTELPRD